MTVRSVSATRRMSRGVLSIWTLSQGAAAPGWAPVNSASRSDFPGPLAPASQPDLIARPDPCLDGFGGRGGEVSRLATARDFADQTLETRPARFGVVLVNGLLDNRFDTGTQAHHAWPAAARQKSRDFQTISP